MTATGTDTDLRCSLPYDLGGFGALLETTRLGIGFKLLVLPKVETGILGEVHRADKCKVADILD